MLGTTGGEESRPDCSRMHLAVREGALAHGRPYRRRCALGFWLAALPVPAGTHLPWGLIECGPLVDAHQTEADFAARLEQLGLGAKDHAAIVATWRGLSRRSHDETEGLLDMLQLVSAQIGKEVQRHRLLAVAHEPAAVAAAKRYVATHLSEPLSLGRVAKDVGLSSDHFSRVFKRTTKVTFGEYVNASRIAHARELLAGSGQRVVEVAYACGFESVSHFNRVFRREVGASPTEYRRNVTAA